MKTMQEQPRTTSRFTVFATILLFIFQQSLPGLLFAGDNEGLAPTIENSTSEPPGVSIDEVNQEESTTPAPPVPRNGGAPLSQASAAQANNGTVELFRDNFDQSLNMKNWTFFLGKGSVGNVNGSIGFNNPSSPETKAVLVSNQKFGGNQYIEAEIGSDTNILSHQVSVAAQMREVSSKKGGYTRRYAGTLENDELKIDYRGPGGTNFNLAKVKVGPTQAGDHLRLEVRWDSKKVPTLTAFLIRNGKVIQSLVATDTSKTAIKGGGSVAIGFLFKNGKRAKYPASAFNSIAVGRLS